MKSLDPQRRDRERKVLEIVRAFLQAIQTFGQQYEKYQQGSLRFSDLARLVDDRGQSILFALKESCHSLFRQSDSGVSEKEQIFDLTIGTFFHLAMKMREDLYQLEFYGPKYLAWSGKGEGSSEQQSLVREFKELISRAQTSFREGMEGMSILLKEILPQFQDLLGEYRENGLLLRFILEEKNFWQEIWGQDSLENLFQRFYGPDQARPYRLAGDSYFQSGFYAQAIKSFSLAIEKSPADENLQFMYYLSQGMEQFYSLAPLSSLKSLEKCLSLSTRKELLEFNRDTIHRVCQKIQEEFPGRRKSDHDRDLVKKAKALQRHLEKLSPRPSSLPPPPTKN